MSVKVMGFPSRLGAPVRATASGPRALRAAGILGTIQRLSATAADLGDLAVPEPVENLPLLAQVFPAASNQVTAIRQAITPADLLITLGGDHSTSLGSVTAAQQLGHDFDLVWVDAHPDFNRPDTSPSGFPHGMVLAALAGLLPGWPRAVAPERIWILGARDIDTGEQAALTANGVHVFSPADALARLPEIQAALGRQMFISFDLDAFDPVWAPGVGTPVADGFSRQQGLLLLKRLAAGRQVIGLDVVELKPEVDATGATAQLALEVIRQVLVAQKIWQAQRAPGPWH